MLSVVLVGPHARAGGTGPELLSTPDGAPRTVISEGRTSKVQLSATGRFAALLSDASDLVDEDPERAPGDGKADVVLRDRRAGSTVLVSQGLRREGREFGLVAMSDDGQRVLFLASERRGPPRTQVFLRDLRASATLRVPGDGALDLSPDGRYVARAVDSAPGATNRRPVVLVRDLRRRRTIAIRRGLARGEWIESARLSRGGRFVAYASTRGRPGAGRFVRTVWRADTRTGRVRIVDRRRTYPEPSSFAGLDISASGRYVAYSVATVRRGVPPQRSLCVCAFRADARTGRRVLLSRTSRGRVHGLAPSVSADGRRAAFTALALGPDPGTPTTAVRDAGRGRAVLVPRRPNDAVEGPSLSADGRVLAFLTQADDVREAAGVRELDDEESYPQAYAVGLRRRLPR